MGEGGPDLPDDDHPGLYDPDLFYRRVVRERRNRPEAVPGDLRLRYMLPRGATRESLSAHLLRVLGDWESRVEDTREGQVYAALLRAHRRLAADPEVDLEDPAWWERYVPPPAGDVDGADPAEPPSPARPPRETPAVAPPAPSGTSRAAQDGTPPPASHAPVPPDLRLRAARVGDEVELVWVWPPWGTQADVSWDGRRVRVSKQEYVQLGRWRRGMGDGRVTVDVRVGGVDGDSAEATVEVGPRRQEVHYTVRRLWWRLAGRTYRVTFTTDRPPMEWCTIAVGYSTARVLPPATADLHRVVDSTPVSPGSLHRTVTVPRDARWLRCILVEGDSVDLVDPDIERLRVRPWPR